MSESENDFEIDDHEDEDLVSHTRLIKAINTLDKTQHILKPTREGYSGKKSEFHVSKSNNNLKSGVAVGDLIKILQSSGEHADTGKKLKTAQKNIKTLKKPLEKHEAAVIKRSTGFDEVKKKLGRWDAVVSRNRTLEHQKFPIETTIFKQPVTKDYLSKFTLKSELENELDKLKPTEEEPAEETFPMTMSEMMEHRKESARLRAKQSYKEAKARRQSKIKSKKFHRIMRKEKIKQQLKDFENLQKTDPEQALRKLEQLEKTRAQERVTLRHKSTGQWAKNKLVRAKYDKETRQQLAEQLAISRELTQKSQIINESESDEEIEKLPILPEDASNPWFSQVKNDQSNEVADFVSGYKKYWEDRNNVSRVINGETSKDQEITQIIAQRDNNNIKKEIENKIEKPSSTPKIKNFKTKKVSAKSTVEWNVENFSLVTPTKEKKVQSSTLTVEDIFDDFEYRLKTKVTDKINSLTPDVSSSKRKNKTSKAYGDDSSSNLEFKRKNIRPQIDEELNESTNKIDSQEQEVLKKQIINAENFNTAVDNVNNNINSENKIDPDKFVAIKPRHLLTTLPDMDIDGDHLDDEENEKKMTIAEAFEDDDIVAEFQQDKDNDINKNKPQIEDLSLPGWGSWAGKGLKQKKRKRFTFNVPKVLPRQDSKKDNVIINESKDFRIKAHQVSELPFPFTSVSDFESTLRAPIGNTFIPETAHKKLTRPAVVVKTGIIIEPMDESQLFVKKRENHSLPLKFNHKISS